MEADKNGQQHRAAWNGGKVSKINDLTHPNPPWPVAVDISFDFRTSCAPGIDLPDLSCETQIRIDRLCAGWLEETNSCALCNTAYTGNMRISNITRSLN